MAARQRVAAPYGQKWSRGENNGNARLSEVQVKELRAAFRAGGVSRMALARRYGVSWQCINRIICGVLRRHDGGFRVGDAKLRDKFFGRGSRHGGSKLNEEKVRELRRRAKKGESQTALAREFGVTQGAVWRVLRRETWRTV